MLLIIVIYLLNDFNGIACCQCGAVVVVIGKQVSFEVKKKRKYCGEMSAHYHLKLGKIYTKRNIKILILILTMIAQAVKMGDEDTKCEAFTIQFGIFLPKAAHINLFFYFPFLSFGCCCPRNVKHENFSINRYK